MNHNNILLMRKAGAGADHVTGRVFPMTQRDLFHAPDRTLFSLNALFLSLRRAVLTQTGTLNALL